MTHAERTRVHMLLAERILAERGGQASITTVGRLLGISLQTASTILRRMEAEKLVVEVMPGVYERIAI